MSAADSINDRQRISAIIEPSPLGYWHGESDVRRLSLIDTTYPKSEKPRTNFDETTVKMSVDGERREYKRPGATRGTVSYVDYVDSGARGVDIAYTQVHPEHQGKGLAREAITRLYEMHPGRTVHWGKLMEPQMGSLYESFQKSHPEQTGSAKYYFRT